MNNWVVNVDSWAPRSRLNTPVSATAYESLLACPLQLLYVRDDAFPRRGGPYARIGTAFHKSLESLPSVLSAAELATAVGRVLGTFRVEIQRQREETAANPREASIPWPEERVHHAEQSLALLIHRLWRPAVETQQRENAPPHTEVALTTRDGFLTGIIDRVDATNDGVVIVDYKSAESYDEEHLERFRRQLLLYAYLWLDRTGEWADHGIVNFLLLGREVLVELSIEDAEDLVDHVRAAFTAASGSTPRAAARPGDACTYCDYRPWCEPFWDHVASGNLVHRAVDGVVIARSASSQRILHIRHGEHTSQLVLDESRLDLAEQIAIGTRIRVIDPIVDGAPPVGRYRLTNRSEIWTVL